MKPDELLQQVRNAIEEIEQVLNQGTFAVPREDYPTVHDLMNIKEQLRRIESELNDSKVPLKSQRNVWIGRIILDDWWKYSKEPLAKKLLLISDMYLRKLP